MDFRTPGGRGEGARVPEIHVFLVRNDYNNILSNCFNIILCCSCAPFDAVCRCRNEGHISALKEDLIQNRLNIKLI